VANSLIVIVLMIYFLASLPSIKHAGYSLAPASKRPRVSELGDKIIRSTGSYVAGAFLVAVCAGVSTLIFSSLVGLGDYAFNDAHAMMAFVGAQRHADAEALLAAQRAALDAPGDNAMFTREVGQPLCEALWAFGRADHAHCVELLRPLLGQAHRFGGSHAQRDVIDLTLIEAARRDGQLALYRGLLAERARPH
jgi:hypothetical protein